MEFVSVRRVATAAPVRRQTVLQTRPVRPQPSVARPLSMDGVVARAARVSGQQVPVTTVPTFAAATISRSPTHLPYTAAVKTPTPSHPNLAPPHAYSNAAETAPVGAQASAATQTIAAQSTPEVVPPPARRLTVRTALMYSMAVVLFGFGLYVGFSGLRANRQVAAQVKTIQKQQTAAQSGAGMTHGVPSTSQPSPRAVRAYTVAPQLPRHLDIPKLRVHARVLPMAVDEKNELQAPVNIYDAGWYNASAQPGQPGAMLVDGHSGIGKTRGVFHDVAKLVPGDELVVTRGDGTQFTYKVATVQTVPVGEVDMTAMMTPADPAKPGLNIITCTGRVVPGTTQLDQRVLVRATLT